MYLYFSEFLDLIEKHLIFLKKLQSKNDVISTKSFLMYFIPKS